MSQYKLEITRPYSYEIQLTILKKTFWFWTTETQWKVTSLYGGETKLIQETVDLIEKFKAMYNLDEPDIIGSPHAEKIS